MAVQDFRTYLAQVQLQYLEMKQDLADFEEAFRSGFITEDRLAEVKATVSQLEINYQRLLYVAYLLELPKSKVGKKWFNRRPKHRGIAEYFETNQASSEKVLSENKNLLESLRQQLEELTENK